jgi:hypothetical protein
MLRRCARSAGTRPTIRPIRIIRPMPMPQVWPATPWIGIMPPLAAAMPGTISATSPMPISPPKSSISTPSASTIASTLRAENPMVFSTANSEVRSRTACIMVLPVSSNSVKNTAPMIAATTKPMLINCLMKEAWKACSVWVLVS